VFFATVRRGKSQAVRGKIPESEAGWGGESERGAVGLENGHDGESSQTKELKPKKGHPFAGGEKTTEVNATRIQLG